MMKMGVINLVTVPVITADYLKLTKEMLYYLNIATDYSQPAKYYRYE